VAHVFLRSVSGRSSRELGEGPLPADLSPYLASPAAREKVLRVFDELGFRARGDAMGLTISIEGPRMLFTRVFGISGKRLNSLSAAETVTLPVPREVQELVDQIVLVPPPEFFQRLGPA
jgi:hypothetical protein